MLGATVEWDGYFCLHLWLGATKAGSSRVVGGSLLGMSGVRGTTYNMSDMLASCCHWM